MRPVSQAARHARTVAVAQRHGASWSAEEDAELAACHDDDALEAFAVRWSRGFRAVEQRRRRPRIATLRTGTGWV